MKKKTKCKCKCSRPLTESETRKIIEEETNKSIAQERVRNQNNRFALFLSIVGTIMYSAISAHYIYLMILGIPSINIDYQGIPVMSVSVLVIAVIFVAIIIPNKIYEAFAYD